MPQARRDQVHDKRVQVLQPGPDHERGRGRGHREGVGQGLEDRVDELEPQLGAELAVERGPGRPVALLQGHRQRPPDLHVLEHRPLQLAVRTDLHGEELPGLASAGSEAYIFLCFFPF